MVSAAERTKIFILSSTLTTGGAEMVIRYLALGIGRHGYDPYIICLKDKGKVGRGLESAGLPVTGSVSRWSSDPATFFKLRNIFRDDPDAVLLSLDHHDAIFLGAFASRAAGLKARALCVHSTGLWSKRGTFSISDRLALPSYGKIVALSSLHAEYLREHEGIDAAKIVRISNGVDTARFRPAPSAGDRSAGRAQLGIPDGDFVVTIVAALRPEKNHMMFLDAAEILLSRESDYTFLIVGDGPEGEKLRARAAGMRVKDKIRFLGLRDDTERIFSLSDVSVLCSHPVVETFPMTVLEGMSSGIPVIATAVGSLPEMFTDGEEGFLIGTGDVESLARIIEMLKKGENMRKDMGRRARMKAERDYSIERMISGYAALFREMLAERRKG